MFILLMLYKEETWKQPNRSCHGQLCVWGSRRGILFHPPNSSFCRRGSPGEGGICLTTGTWQSQPSALLCLIVSWLLLPCRLPLFYSDRKYFTNSSTNTNFPYTIIDYTSVGTASRMRIKSLIVYWALIRVITMKPLKWRATMVIC